MGPFLACENIRFTSLFAAGDVSRLALFVKLTSHSGVLLYREEPTYLRLVSA